MKLENQMRTKTRWGYTEEYKAEEIRLILDFARPVDRQHKT